MLCKGSPELGKSAGKGSPELGASGRGTLFMCQETCLSEVPSAGKGPGSLELEANDRGKQAVCQETLFLAWGSEPRWLEMRNVTCFDKL